MQGLGLLLGFKRFEAVLYGFEQYDKRSPDSPGLISISYKAYGSGCRDSWVAGCRKVGGLGGAGCIKAYPDTTHAFRELSIDVCFGAGFGG